MLYAVERGSLQICHVAVLFMHTVLDCMFFCNLHCSFWLNKWILYLVPLTCYMANGCPPPQNKNQKIIAQSKKNVIHTVEQIFAIIVLSHIYCYMSLWVSNYQNILQYCIFENGWHFHFDCGTNICDYHPRNAWGRHAIFFASLT